MLTPDTPARRAVAGPLRNARLLLAFGFAFMLGSHLTGFSALAQSPTPTDLFVIRNSAGHPTAKLRSDGYWLLGGNLYPNAGTIPLVSSRKYWSLKTSAGDVLLAIDCETGDMRVKGLVTTGAPVVPGTDSVVLARTASDGTPVAALTPPGNLAIPGEVLPKVLGVGIPPFNTSDTWPPWIDWNKVINDVFVATGGLLDPGKQVVVPEPFAQCRIMLGAPTSGQALHDLSFRYWRTPWIMDGTAESYDLRLASRFWDFNPYGVNYPSTIGYLIAGRTTSETTSLAACAPAEMDYSVIHASWTDPYTVVTHNDLQSVDLEHEGTSWPTLSAPGLYSLSMNFNDMGNRMHPLGNGKYWPADANDGLGHNSNDAQQPNAETRAFLFGVKFPRDFLFFKQPYRHNDFLVSTMAKVLPAELSLAGLKRLTLEFREPGDSGTVYMKRFKKNEPDANLMLLKDLAKWDGRLYPGGNESDPTQARFLESSDFKMVAHVNLGKIANGEPYWPASQESTTFTLEAPSYRFIESNGTAYGFDNFCGPTSGSEAYKNPCVSVKKGGSTSVVLAESISWNLQLAQSDPPSSLFSFTPTVITGQDSSIPIQISANTNGDVPSSTMIKVLPVDSKYSEYQYGRDLNVVAYPEKTVRVHLVRVQINNQGLNAPNQAMIDCTAIQNYLNNVFKQAVVSFVVTEEPGIVTFNYDEAGLETGKLDWSGTEGDRLATHLSTIPGHEGDMIVGFVSEIAPSNIGGYAFSYANYNTRKVCFAKTISGDVTDVHHIVAHELAHLIGQLRDMKVQVSPILSPLSMTVDDLNLMSYAWGGERLRKYQWDQLN